MKAKDLRNSILQLAVQGKLVPQDPNDEPASVLLERIRDERAKLIKERKIKAPKGGESVIYRASDGSYYEKRGKGEPVCIDDEIPFEIPESWEWARMSTLCDFGKCVNVEYEVVPPGTWNLDLEDLEKDTGAILQKKRKQVGEKGSTKHVFEAGMVLYSKLRPYLNKVVVADENGVCTSEILPLRFNGVHAEYAQVVLMAPLFVDYAQAHSYGVKMPRLGTSDGARFLIPLPPYNEQLRIQERLSSALAHVREYKGLQEARERLDAELPGKLRKSVLQLAVQGKLVEQDPTDEPASVLLERIRDERAKLIKAGKLKAPKGGESIIYRASDGGYYEKRGKGNPVCIDDEIPFEIPESWEWARLETIATLFSGFAFKSHMYQRSGIQVVRISDLQDNAISTKDAVYYEKDPGLDKYLIQTNSILICMTGSIGKMTLVTDKLPRYLNQRVGMLVASLEDTTPYIWIFLHTRSVIDKWISAKTSTNGNIKSSDIEQLLIPLPPLVEQRRIVDSCKELLDILG